MSDSDAAIQIEMPQLSSQADEEGAEAGATLASWLVGVGDSVEEGEVIAELETDKATVELESPATGTIGSLDVAEGTEGIKPGAILGVISGAASAAAEASEVSSGPQETSPPVTEEPRAEAPREEAEEVTADVGPRKSTPLARRAAAANSIDVAEVAGSGPGGRIVEADILRAAGSAPAPVQVSAPAAGASPPASNAAPIVESLADGEGYRSERLSAMRKTIARRLTESKQQVPHFYLRTRVAMDELVAVRARLNAGLAEEGREVKISVNDFIVRAAAQALRDVPEANVQYTESAMRVFDRVDISVAVATDGGLVTPVVRDADRKGLTALADEVKSLAGLAREGKLKPEQYQGGTLTISNLGMYGIETVYPILNPPQACIVGVGAATEEPVVREGAVVVGRIAAITLAADHRAVDGAVGAQFLAALRDRLEDPLGMIL